MIHQLKFIHANETFIFRFTADRIGQLRQTLAEFWKRGLLPLGVIFEASLRARAMVSDKETSAMDEMEELRRQWLAKGCNLQINANAAGWEVILWNAKTYRPPHGVGGTLFEAMAAAEVDRVRLANPAKKTA